MDRKRNACVLSVGKPGGRRERPLKDSTVCLKWTLKKYDGRSWTNSSTSGRGQEANFVNVIINLWVP
jgi:hypothetical protein